MIKVKYGDTLRRFSARVNEDGQLDLDIDGLRSKILGLFHFPLDSDLTLTYIDEDGDVVTLVDDNDLYDVMRQRLKFLRIDVRINNDKFGKSYARSSGSSTPMRSPQVQNPIPNLNTVVADVMESMPEPLCEAFSKLSLDLASKAVTSNPPVLAEIIGCVSKMAQPYLSAVPQSQVGADSSIETGPSEIPKPPRVPTFPNASNDGSATDLLLKSNSTTKTGEGMNSENIPTGLEASDTIVSTPVDLNQVPPCDSNTSICKSLNSVLAASSATAGESGKGSGNQSACLPSEGLDFPCEFSFLASLPARPLGNECPFSGIPVESGPFMPPHAGPYKRSNSQNDAVVGMFHKGVQCDGCGIHPITGPRYKSKVKEDYDLCSICFAQIGNEDDYIKMDRPVSYWHTRSFKGLHNPTQNPWAIPPPPNVIRTCGMRSARSKLDSRFIMDVNVLDGTMMAPCTYFTKIWRIRNSGSVVWPHGVRLVWIGGDRFSHADAADAEIPTNGVPVDGELDIAVDFTSPALPGRYISYWRMTSPSGVKFGQRVWVLIQVDASLKGSFCNDLQGLNLNLPPYCSGSKGPEILDVNQPVGGLLEPTHSSSLSRPVRPELVEQALKGLNDQELNFSVNDTLLVGHDASVPVSPKCTSSMSNPIIDLSETASTGTSQAFPAMDATTSSEGLGFGVNDAVEKNLLKELQEMGFKHVDLNKEILRLNEYNLEQSLDDLCGVSEWDPILEELQEMGFCDEEMNKKLLKKNNGSIKRVVMDLLNGEKA